MRKTEFNARDYYPVEGSWEKAHGERMAMLAVLQGASDYFLAVAEKAQDYTDEREARRGK